MVHPGMWNFQSKQTTCSNDNQDDIDSQVHWQSHILQSWGPFKKLLIAYLFITVTS